MRNALRAQPIPQMHEIRHSCVKSPCLTLRFLLCCTCQGTAQKKSLPNIDSCTVFVDLAHICSLSPNAGTIHKLLHGPSAPIRDTKCQQGTVLSAGSSPPVRQRPHLGDGQNDLKTSRRMSTQSARGRFRNQGCVRSTHQSFIPALSGLPVTRPEPQNSAHGRADPGPRRCSVNNNSKTIQEQRQRSYALPAILANHQRRPTKRKRQS